MSSIIRIRKNIISPPIFETDEANIVEFYDGNTRELVALLNHQFNDNIWLLTTKTDPDWDAALIRLGYKTVKNIPFKK